MISRPRQPDHLPSLAHNGQEISVIRHYGFSGNGVARMLYATKDNNGERHWRGSYEEIVHFINKNNEPSASTSAGSGASNQGA